MKHGGGTQMTRWLFGVAVTLCFAAVSLVAYGQLLNAGHLSVAVRQAETVFDNGGSPWPFFSQTPSVAYDQGGSGIGYVATAGCLTNGSSYRSDYINFKTDTGQTPPFRIGCFLTGQLYRTTINISAVNPGPYVVNLNVANGGGSSAVVAVLLDGAQVATITIPTTGSYDTFTTAQSAQFNASVGNHVITISCLTGDSLNNACGDMRWFQGANPSGAAVPQPAMAAGFTNHIIHSDFSTSFYANTANWLECSGNSTTNPNAIWYRGWIQVLQGTSCNNINITTDPTFGGQVLQLYVDDAIINSQGQSITAIETVRQDGVVGRAFTYGYFEVVGRSNRLHRDTATDLWSTGLSFGGNVPVGSGPGQDSVEYDGIEWLTSDSGGSCVHNQINGAASCNTFGFSVPPGFSSWSFTDYHRYAWRITGDGTNGTFFCSYYEQTPYVSGLVFEGCIATPSQTSQQFQGLNASSSPIMSSGTSFNWSPDGQPALGSPYITYVRSFDAWVCPAYPSTTTVAQNVSANRCYTSSANP